MTPCRCHTVGNATLPLRIMPTCSAAASIAQVRRLEAELAASPESSEGDLG
ncbi:hypothetical protein [Sorangium sp. So ce1151]|uniref:hypothetical protein n=1 Tax=Sorangium sp. So ce1151 TaxID=3133332 RepID=UPI003F63B460